jgi:hypothetical protein
VGFRLTRLEAASLALGSLATLTLSQSAVTIAEAGRPFRELREQLYSSTSSSASGPDMLSTAARSTSAAARSPVKTLRAARAPHVSRPPLYYDPLARGVVRDRNAGPDRRT